MNCAKHPDVPASAFCRTCGKALCPNCARDVRGVIYCEECLASRLGDTIPATPPPYATVPPVSTPVVVRQGGSPGLAALLSIIPGVGQMYNEQYAKGLIFVLVFAVLIQIADSVSGVIGGLAIPAFWIYQIFDAYKTAEARRFGQPLPDPFGLNEMLGGKNKAAYSTPAPTTYTAAPGEPVTAGVPVAPVEEVPPKPGAPVGAIVLIGLGVLFLLDSFELFRFDWFSRTWPVILIIIGVWIFIRRRDAAAR